MAKRCIYCGGVAQSGRYSDPSCQDCERRMADEAKATKPSSYNDRTRYTVIYSPPIPGDSLPEYRVGAEFGSTEMGYMNATPALPFGLVLESNYGHRYVISEKNKKVLVR